MRLAGRRAVVTGGGGGLGEVIVRTLAAEGMHVLVADRDGAAASRVAVEVGGSGIAADLSTADGEENVVAACADRVDVLINCAGGWSPTGRNYPDASTSEWDAVLTLNLRAPMLLLQRLREPLSRSPVGAAVSISSSAGRGHDAYECPEYAVAKAGLIRLTTSVADWADRFGIRVNCIAPGWIGLPRAISEVAALPAPQRPQLIPPEEIATQVITLVTDPRSVGRVVVMDEGEPSGNV
jgi:NAD(P)-dependent dehydrogenase (short-subunit alcohol dehydrogenase family)